MKHDPTEDVIRAVTAIIRMATPRQSYVGKQARNRLIRNVIDACKTMTYDRRVKRI